jgi:hypothetical protein
MLDKEKIKVIASRRNPWGNARQIFGGGKRERERESE